MWLYIKLFFLYYFAFPLKANLLTGTRHIHMNLQSIDTAYDLKNWILFTEVHVIYFMTFIIFCFPELMSSFVNQV